MGDVLAVLDLEGWWSGDAVARRRIASAFDAACRDTGFLQIVGHGVDEPLRSGISDASDAFFALAEDEKRRVEPPSRDVNRGYSARRSESLAYTLGATRPPDLAEAFIVGNDHADNPLIAPGDPYYEAERGRSFAPNLWPARPAGFEPVVWAYFRAVRNLSHTLADVAACALGLDADFFGSRVDRAVETMRMNWYRRDADEIELDQGQMGLGAHTDYGILTVLMADPLPGLQVVGRDGAWHDVVPLAEGFVINIGDALAVWTNDVWTSTIHRVVPAAIPGATARRSFAFFQDGNHDAVIECLATCCSADNPAKYPAISLGAHVTDKIRGGRSLTTVDGTAQTQGFRERVDT